MTNQCKVRNNILGASENDLGVGESENWFSLHAEFGSFSCCCQLHTLTLEFHMK